MTQTQAGSIIEKFGGVSALSKKLGHKHPTTVDGWRRRGWIPADQQPHVLLAGQELSPPLTPNDFFFTSAFTRTSATPETEKLKGVPSRPPSAGRWGGAE